MKNLNIEQTILDLLPESVLVLDLKSVITYANPAALRMYEVDQGEDLVGKKFVRMFPSEFEEAFHKQIDELLFGGESKKEEQQRVTVKSKLLVVDSYMHVIKNAEPEVVGILIVDALIQSQSLLTRKAYELINSSPDGVVIVNQSAQIVFVNAMTLKLFEYSAEELLGQKIELLIPQKFRDVHVAHRDKYLDDPSPREMGVGLDLYGVKKGGEEFSVEISLSPIETDDGMKYVSASVRDVSARVLEKRERHQLLENSPDPLLIANNEGEIVYTNNRIVEVFGYTPEEVLGKRVELLMPERFRKRHVGHLAKYFQNPKVRAMGAGLELYGLRKSGEEFPIELSLSPVETKDGVRAVATIRDVSDRRDQRLLVEKNDEISQIIYIVSHDLQEPLNSIQQNMIMMKIAFGDKFGDDIEEKFNKMELSVERLKTLIVDLLSYSRVGQHRESVPINLNELVAEVIESLSALIGETNSKVTVKGELAEIRGLHADLELLFQNLIQNGMKFHREGVRPVIEIELLPDNSNWHFIVRDNGIGIEEKQFHKLFEIFQRLHSKEDYPGNGIGLAHCKKIVSQHNGKIWIESEVGKGSTFHVTIPKEIDEQD